MRDVFAFFSGVWLMAIVFFDHGNVPFLAYVFAGFFLAFFVFGWCAEYSREKGDDNDE